MNYRIMSFVSGIGVIAFLTVGPPAQAATPEPACRYRTAVYDEIRRLGLDRTYSSYDGNSWRIDPWVDFYLPMPHINILGARIGPDDIDIKIGPRAYAGYHASGSYRGSIANNDFSYYVHAEAVADGYFDVCAGGCSRLAWINTSPSFDFKGERLLSAEATGGTYSGNFDLPINAGGNIGIDLGFLGVRGTVTGGGDAGGPIYQRWEGGQTRYASCFNMYPAGTFGVNGHMNMWANLDAKGRFKIFEGLVVRAYFYVRFWGSLVTHNKSGIIEEVTVNMQNFKVSKNLSNPITGIRGPSGFGAKPGFDVCYWTLWDGWSC